MKKKLRDNLGDFYLWKKKKMDVVKIDLKSSEFRGTFGLKTRFEDRLHANERSDIEVSLLLERREQQLEVLRFAGCSGIEVGDF